MIQLILDAYIEKTKYKITQPVAFVLAMVSLISALVFTILGYIINKCFFIGLIISVFFIFLIITESCKKDRIRVNQRVIGHNERLDKLKDILLSFTFTDDKKSKKKNDKNSSWYSSNKIKYLVSMCDNLLYRNNHSSDKIFTTMKTPIFSVLGFAIGGIFEKATIEEIITITFVILIFIVFIFMLSWLNNFLNTVCFKNNSIERIADLKLDLLDLLARDFPESLDLEIKIESDN